MTYLVNQTDGTLLTTIYDGTVDRNFGDIALIGKQVLNYGEIQNENIVRLLEHFSNSTSPNNPLEGQVWWNKTDNVMKVFDSVSWRSLTGFTSSPTAPLLPYIGDQWWDTINQQYRVYAGAEWVLIGPAYSILDGKTGAIVENVYDTSGNKHTIIKVYHNNYVTSIINRDPVFTPNVAIAGFTVVQPGISFTSEVTAIKLYGTATNADFLGNLAPTQFIRSDIDQISTGHLQIHNQLDVGSLNEFNVNVAAGTTSISNQSTNGDFAINVSPSGNLSRAITISGVTGLTTVAANPVTGLGVVTKQYADVMISTLRTDLTATSTGYIAANVLILNNSITAVQTNLTNAVNTIYNTLAPLANPLLTGIPRAPTAPLGTNSTQIATTSFVGAAITAIDYTKIYNNGTSVKTWATSIETTVNAALVSTATNLGIQTITQPEHDATTMIATTAFVTRSTKNFVLNSTKYQPTVYIAATIPSNAVGVDGDIWYQYI